jgi:alpha-L-rhamnosidase
LVFGRNPNTTARIHVPAAGRETVMEGGQPVAAAEGVAFERMENGAAVYQVGGGKYQFAAPYPAS